MSQPDVTLPPRKRKLTPLFMSVLVVPGSGQLMQRRWLAGGLFFFAFFIFFTGAFHCMNQALSATCAAVIAGEGDLEFNLITFGPGFWFFVGAVVVYVLGILDTLKAEKRRGDVSPEQNDGLQGGIGPADSNCGR